MGHETEHLIQTLRDGNPRDVVAAGRQLIEHLAQNPFLVTLNIHPIGFLHAKLADSGRQTVRLHLWPSPPIAPQDPPWLVHRHAWPLTSYVLHGSVINELYDVDQEADGARCLYAVEYEDQISVMRSIGLLATCERKSRQAYSAGEKYQVNRSEFHSTTAASHEPTATIAVTGTPSDDPPLVVGEAKASPEYRFQRRTIDATASAAVLDSFQ